VEPAHILAGERQRFTLNGLTMPASAVEGVPGLGSLGLYGYRDLDLDA
jgi:hypothetical protein